MFTLKRMILDFITEIRIDNRFNDELWANILKELNDNIELWKLSGNVPKGIVSYLLDLVSLLSAGSRFADDDTLLKNGRCRYKNS